MHPECAERLRYFFPGDLVSRGARRLGRRIIERDDVLLEIRIHSREPVFAEEQQKLGIGTIRQSILARCHVATRIKIPIPQREVARQCRRQEPSVASQAKIHAFDKVVLSLRRRIDSIKGGEGA